MMGRRSRFSSLISMKRGVVRAAISRANACGHSLGYSYNKKPRQRGASQGLCKRLLAFIALMPTPGHPAGRRSAVSRSVPSGIARNHNEIAKGVGFGRRPSPYGAPVGLVVMREHIGVVEH